MNEELFKPIASGFAKDLPTFTIPDAAVLAGHPHNKPALLARQALDAVACWTVEQLGDAAHARGELPDARRKPGFRLPGTPAPVLIVGGASTGNPAAEIPCREGSPADVTLLSADAELPCDRVTLPIGAMVTGMLKTSRHPTSTAPMRWGHDTAAIADLLGNARVWAAYASSVPRSLPTRFQLRPS